MNAPGKVLHALRKTASAPAPAPAAATTAPTDLVALVASMTVSEVIAAVQDGDLTLTEVLAAEEAGKQRLGILTLGQ